METRTLTDREAFGFVNRSDEGTACGGSSGVYCQIIDDASVYYKMRTEGEKARVYQELTEDFTDFPGVPTGRIPAFYRALIIQRRFLNLAGRIPTIGEMVRILSVVDGAARNDARVDDAWTTNTLVRANLGLPLDKNESAFLQAQAKGGGEKGSSSSDSSGGGSSAAAGGGGMLLGVVAVAAVILLLGRR